MHVFFPEQAPCLPGAVAQLGGDEQLALAALLLHIARSPQQRR